VSRADVARSFLESDAARVRAIQDYYRMYLQREASPADLQVWLGWLL
jgi:hypothetical protein